jgi:hypothetical protein
MAITITDIHTLQSKAEAKELADKLYPYFAVSIDPDYTPTNEIETKFYNILQGNSRQASPLSILLLDEIKRLKHEIHTQNIKSQSVENKLNEVKQDLLNERASKIKIEHERDEAKLNLDRKIRSIPDVHALVDFIAYLIVKHVNKANKEDKEKTSKTYAEIKNRSIRNKIAYCAAHMHRELLSDHEVESYESLTKWADELFKPSCDALENINELVLRINSNPHKALNHISEIQGILDQINLEIGDAASQLMNEIYSATNNKLYPLINLESERNVYHQDMHSWDTPSIDNVTMRTENMFAALNSISASFFKEALSDFKCNLPMYESELHDEAVNEIAELKLALDELHEYDMSSDENEQVIALIDNNMKEVNNQESELMLQAYKEVSNLAKALDEAFLDIDRYIDISNAF